MKLAHTTLTLAVALNLNSCRTADKTTAENSKPAKENAPTGDSGELALHAWANYHWARTTPTFDLQLGDNLTSADWKQKLTKTSADWNNPTAYGGTTTPIVTKVVVGTGGTKCRMVRGTVQVCNGKYGRNGWLGLASINLSGEHITQGSAKMNDTYFSTATYNNPNERLHVMCQEVAHAFGLDHQSEDGSSQNSCMDYFSNTGANATSTQSTTPNAHDFEQLNSLYAHLDTTTTVASPSAANVSYDSDKPKTWGELKKQSKDGRGSFYHRENEDGTHTVTHVFWTEEAAAKCKTCDHRD